MKILVLSDTHGDLKSLEKAVNKYGRKADIIVHCGDGTRGEAMWLKNNCTDSAVICVKGNCDFGSSLNDVEVIDVSGKKIMITHGHLFSAKYGMGGLYRKAKEQGADIVLFGHTHTATDTTIDGVQFINPGSCGGWHPTCAVAEIDSKGNVLVNQLMVE